MSFHIPCATKHSDVAISATGLDAAYLPVAYGTETGTLPGALHAPVEKLLPALRASAPANPPAAQDHKHRSARSGERRLRRLQQSWLGAATLVQLARPGLLARRGQSGQALAAQDEWAAGGRAKRRRERRAVWRRRGR